MFKSNQCKIHFKFSLTIAKIHLEMNAANPEGRVVFWRTTDSLGMSVKREYKYIFYV